MTSVENLFSNFNDLSKPKTILDTPTNYNKDVEPDMLKTSLQQGSKFKKYQNKIIKKTKPLNNLENPYDTNNLKEGFQGLPNLDLNKNGLTRQSTNIIDQTDYSGQQGNIDQLRAEYNATLKEYQTLTANLQGATANFFDRVNSNNPYLNKTIRFTTGHICYVTNQGVVKYIPSMEIWNSVNAPKEFIQLDIPWQDSYSTPGTPINTKPPLLSGTFVQFGQSFGGEGDNVFVNDIVTNPQDKYIGCYNDKPEATEINFVPVMNNTNTVSGFYSYASSIYLNDNNMCGPWCGFDRNSGSMWHSAVEAAHNYNGQTGEYTGTWGVGANMKNGSQLTIMGEFLQINSPSVWDGRPGIPLTKYDLQGRQGCCGTPSGRSPNSWYILGWDAGIWNEVDRRENEALDQETKTYTISNPRPWKAYLIIITNCGHPQNRDGNRYCVQIAQWNLYTSSEYSFTDADRAMIWNPNIIGYTDFDTCKKYAADNGFKYFSQQAAQPDGTAACLVGDDLMKSQRYGEAFIYNQLALWDSKTTGQTAVAATITNVGTLSIVNSEGGFIFSSDNSQAQPGNYLGCYWDQQNRAMPLVNNGGRPFNYDTCQNSARTQNFGYFGVQDSTTGENAQCGVSNDLNHTTMYGKASNCTKLANGLWSGGAWSNAVYHTTEPGSWYFLILQDDGNMCIYRGSNPNNNQGFIWCTMTNGKQQQPNKNFEAAKSKFGRNWMGGGETLAPGEFIGSNNGAIYLIMQTDGNLVLYTSTNQTACSVNKNGKTVGGGWVNALYEVSPAGSKEDGGKLGYINENSELREYSSDNIQLGNNYTVTKDFDTYGNDTGGAYGGATIDQCKSTCNGSKDCYGFVFDNRNNVCFPKTNQMYPYGGPLRPLPGVDTYLREKKPINRPFGISDIIKNIDTVLFRNYIKGTGNDQYHGLTKATEVEKQKVAELQGKLDSLSSRIAQLSNKFSSGSNSAQTQSKTNTSGLGDYISDLKNTNEKIQLTNSNMSRILNDSDIVVLQKNYSYLFWTILATGSVLVTMNIVKKQ
jgi:hypothetical protein